MNKLWDKTLIKETLYKTICRVVFTKVNGEERVMHCTLNESMIPQTTKETEKRTKKENSEVQAVYDVDSQGWRSFRWDSLKEFKSDLNL